MGMTLIPKRKIQNISQVKELTSHITQNVTLEFPQDRILTVNDGNPVLELKQVGSGKGLFVNMDGAGAGIEIDSAGPEFRFTANDQTDPAGRYRFRTGGDSFIFEKAATASWATATTLLFWGAVAKSLDILPTGLDWYTSIGKGKNNIIIYGEDHANTRAELNTANAAKSASVRRLSVDGGVTTATASWDATVHAGFMLHDFFCNGATELTIATGAVTATRFFHTIDTQADAATDDLDTISGLGTNEFILVKAAHTDRTVVLKHGTGNIQIRAGADISLDNTLKAVLLFYDGTNCVDL